MMRDTFVPKINDKNKTINATCQWEWQSFEVDKVASGALLAVTRKLNDLSTSELARKLKVTDDTIKKWEKGSCNATMLREIASNYMLNQELLLPSKKISSILSIEQKPDSLQKVFIAYEEKEMEMFCERIVIEKETGNSKVENAKYNHLQTILKQYALNKELYKQEYYLRLAGLYKENNQKFPIAEYESYLRGYYDRYNITSIDFKELFERSIDLPVLMYDLIKIFQYRENHREIQKLVKYVFNATKNIRYT